MTAVVVLLVVALVSLLISRVATVALTVTGLPRPVARFQARSALTGAGFTTSESESVVNHPVRRRIVMSLMLLGNVGLATSVAGLLGGFVRADATAGLVRAGFLVLGLAAVYALSKSARVDRALGRLIARALHQHTDLDVRSYERLLHLAGEYSVKEAQVGADSWLAGRALGDLRLRDEGVLVLGITRSDGTYLPVPQKETKVFGGDTLIVYGSDQSIERLGQRPAGRAGDREHAGRAREQEEVRVAQEVFDSRANPEAADDS